MARLQQARMPGFPLLCALVQNRTKREKDPEYAASTIAVQWFVDNYEKYGPLFYFCLGPYPRVVIADPALVRQAYAVTANEVFPKNALFREIKILGNGLLTANGPDWTRQRRLINPAFSHKEVKVRCAIDLSCSLELGDELLSSHCHCVAR